MVLGITLGVAVVVAIDIANASAERAFDLSTDAVAGRATHEITGGPGGLNEDVYTDLRVTGLEVPAAPVLQSPLTSPDLPGIALELLGLDPFAEPPFRDYFNGDSRVDAQQIPIESLTAFLAQPGAVLISSQLASQNGLEIGSVIVLQAAGQEHSAVIVGLLQPDDALSQRALDSLIISDIAAAQELTGRVGLLDRIELILPEGERGAALVSEIEDQLPAGLYLEPVSARQGTIEQMTRAFRVNLTALSLLALVVGLFLIYNTMTFSVVQRRPLFGTLRSLGMTRREVFSLVIIEALLVGIIGALLGLGLGVLLGQGAVQMVTRTVNDLFFAVTVRGVQIPSGSLLKGALLGILATVLTAVPPSWEAASVQPRAALSRASLESRAGRAVLIAAAGGITLLLLGVLFLIIPTNDLVVSFGGTFAVIIGFAALAPVVTVLLMRGIMPLLGGLFGTLGRMAPRDVTNSLSRTAIAIAALMVAVSVTIGVSLMVSSFRATVVRWLEETLRGDIYLSVPGPTSSTPSIPIDPDVLRAIEGQPGVNSIYTLRAANLNSPLGMIEDNATDNPDTTRERSYLFLNVPEDELKDALEDGAVLLSEPLFNRLALPRETDSVTLYTDAGEVDFPVAGVYYDYTSPQGLLLMTREIYRFHWDDPSVTAAAINLAPGLDPDEVTARLRRQLASIQTLNIRPNSTLRGEVLEVFDRTFAITSALQLLATTVAFIGVLSALLALELERGREMGILRAVGLTARQIWGLILMETGLMGGAAGLLAIPTGYALALILVYIINRRSFGWTLQMQVVPEPFIQAFFVAVAAALLAGIYPAWRMSRTREADAMRMET